MGYDATTKQYRLFREKQRDVILCRNVLFQEHLIQQTSLPFIESEKFFEEVEEDEDDEKERKLEASEEDPIMEQEGEQNRYGFRDPTLLWLPVEKNAWIRRLLNNLGFPQESPTMTFSDSQSAMKLAENPMFHRRTKHIETKYHFTRGEIKEGRMELSHVPTTCQLSDGLTKPLQRMKFENMLDGFGMTDPSSQQKSLDLE